MCIDEKSINRRRVLKSVGAVGIGAAVLPSSSSAKGAKAAIEKRRARTIAKEFAEIVGEREGFSDWREEGIRSPELFYGKVTADSSSTNSIEYTPTAWVFPVEDRGDDVGYVAISAKQAESPVLTYGRSTAPQRRVDSAMKVAKASGRSVHKRFLYQGGTQFGVETTDRNLVDLRGQLVAGMDPVEESDRLRFGKSKETDATNWSGSTDDQIYGVPNWTQTDYDDSWGTWDGCSPIAASMVIGYHEGIYDWEEDEKNALIDRLHETMNTTDGEDGLTDPWNVDNGIRKYDQGDNSYDATNNHFEISGNIKDAVAANEPAVLSMANGPYTKDSDGLANGHSVCVVGYRQESCGWVCSNFYHKVHNGYAESPDRVSNGAWDRAMVTRVSVS